jgi:hypothetical protein
MKKNGGGIGICSHIIMFIIIIIIIIIINVSRS